MMAKMSEQDFAAHQRAYGYVAPSERCSANECEVSRVVIALMMLATMICLFCFLATGAGMGAVGAVACAVGEIILVRDKKAAVPSLKRPPGRYITEKEYPGGILVYCEDCKEWGMRSRVSEGLAEEEVEHYLQTRCHGHLRLVLREGEHAFDEQGLTRTPHT